MRPGPMGRGMPIKKRTSHLTIIVTDAGITPEKRKKKAAKTQPVAAIEQTKAEQNVLGAKKEEK
jgi:hypothetical protein